VVRKGDYTLQQLRASSTDLEGFRGGTWSESRSRSWRPKHRPISLLSAHSH